MSHFTPNELMFIIMDDQRIVIADSEDATMSNSNAQTFVDMAEAYVSMRLSKKYAIPLTDLSGSPTSREVIEWNYIKSIIANWWAYELYTSVYAANIPNRNEYAEEYKLKAESMIDKLLGEDPEIELTTQTLSEEGEALTEGPVSSSLQRKLEEEATLSGTSRDSAVDLDEDNIKQGSEYVSNTGRTVQYVKDTDYGIDYVLGKIWRIGGSISNGQDVYVTYYYYPDDPFFIEGSRKETDTYKDE